MNWQNFTLLGLICCLKNIWTWVSETLRAANHKAEGILLLLCFLASTGPDRAPDCWMAREGIDLISPVTTIGPASLTVYLSPKTFSNYSVPKRIQDRISIPTMVKSDFDQHSPQTFCFCYLSLGDFSNAHIHATWTSDLLCKRAPILFRTTQR